MGKQDVNFSEFVIGKAEGFVESDRVSRDEQVPGVWWVRSTGTYRVQTDHDSGTGKLTWVTCTCPYGVRVGAGWTKCSHAVAVMLILLDQQQRPVEEQQRALELARNEGGSEQ